MSLRRCANETMSRMIIARTIDVFMKSSFGKIRFNKNDTAKLCGFSKPEKMEEIFPGNIGRLNVFCWILGV
jgi:hypothetical protein